MTANTLSIIVPVYNEAAAVSLFGSALDKIICELPGWNFEVVFVDDGSTDATGAAIAALAMPGAEVVLIELSRNFGKEAALSAGLARCKGAAAIPMDVDLQDPPALIPKMLELWRQGYDVVLAKRTDRKNDSTFKRISAQLFYRVHNRLSSPEIPENVGDFRLLDRKVIDVLNTLPESCRFMKGLFAWVGFRTACIEYSRPPRAAGSTKFNGWRLWNFALEGITSFSTVPLRVWTYVGVFFAALGLAYAVFLILRVFIQGVDVPGYASLMVMILFLGGLQLIGIGVIGEYLGRTYLESKRRPPFVIRSIKRY